MRERKRLLIQEMPEERNIKFRHKKKTGNRVLDALYSCKRILVYLGIVLLSGGCLYVLFDLPLQEKIVTAIENIFF